jgi:hypothetical protein
LGLVVGFCCDSSRGHPASSKAEGAPAGDGFMPCPSGPRIKLAF